MLKKQVAKSAIFFMVTVSILISSAIVSLIASGIQPYLSLIPNSLSGAGPWAFALSLFALFPIFLFYLSIIIFIRPNAPFQNRSYTSLVAEFFSLFVLFS
ncbi:MAG TPA: hypothetical protein VF300_00385, partial [Methanothrix sp.]